MSRRIVVAPDTFKGSLTTGEVTEALASGLREAGAAVTTLPLADGGEGSVAAALAAGFSPVEVSAADALGERRTSTIALRGGTAVVEVAATCGLAALGSRLDPLGAGSAGLGEAIGAAVRAGATRVVVALGGSASTEAGCGMLASLGARFTDAAGAAFVPTGGSLGRVAAVDLSALAWLDGIRLVGATDVTNPLLGAAGAATVYAPQKGATPDQVALLEAGLSHVAGLMPQADADAPRTGSAGGIGFGLATAGAELVDGAAFFLDLLGFADAVSGADLVVTGEGSLDEQTRHGKLVAAVCRASAPVPVVAVCGRSTLSPRDAASLGLSAVFSVAELTDADTSRDAELTRSLLRRIGRQIGGVDGRG